MEHFFIKSPIGTLSVNLKNKKLIGLRLAEEDGGKKLSPNSTVAKKYKVHILNYLLGKQKLALNKLEVEGTEFQKKVWQHLRKIPFGQVQTYGEVAKAIGHPGAARAVGSACGKNKLLLAVPCHRVVSARGIGGFAIDIKIKKQLLELEKVSLENLYS